MLSRTMFQGVVQSLSLIEMDRNLRQRHELMSLSHMLPNNPNSGVISQQTHPVRVGNGTSLTASPPVRGNLFPESCTPMNANDSTPVLAPQEGIATEGACPETSNMDATKHFIKHHQQNVKDDTASKALSDVYWPNGNTKYLLDTGLLSNDGKPYFGYTLCHLYTKTHSNGNSKRYLYCLGVMACQDPKCNFLQRPMQPKSKKLGAPPLPAKYVCPIHPELPLKWIACTGGIQQGNSRSQNKEDVPCMIVCEFIKDKKQWLIEHKGSHNHPNPPVTKPSPHAVEQFNEIVTANPSLGPQKLRMGSLTNDSVVALDDAFSTINRVKYLWHKTLGRTPIKAQGIHGSIGSLLQFTKDLPEKTFIVKAELVKLDEAIITLQSNYMREILHEANSGMQSDTVEGVIDDPEFTGTIDVHFTSAYDFILERWVPVLISLIFGRSKKHYGSHWRSLFHSYGDSINTSWQSFAAIFPGVTVDWSDALGMSFMEELYDHATITLGDKAIDKKDLLAFLRKCNVHFERSVTRIERNGAVVPPSKKGDFRKLIHTFTNVKSKFHHYWNACQKMMQHFPKAMPWLRWYLHPDRAQTFFPACQNFTSSQADRFSKLSSSTNAQENVGKQFQDLFLVRNRKMSVNEAVLNAWKFVNRFECDRRNSARGMPLQYAQYPRSSTKRTKKMSKNDGRAPDTNKSLNLEKELKEDKETHVNIKDLLDGKQPEIQCNILDEDKMENKTSCNVQTNQTKENKEVHDNKQRHIFNGPCWGMKHNSVINTCALDCWLVLIYAPYHAGQLLTPYPELSNHSSFLSNTFSLLDQNRSEEAKVLWMDLFNTFEMQQAFDSRQDFVNCLGNVNRYYCHFPNTPNPLFQEEVQGVTTVHPMQMSLTMYAEHKFHCCRRKRCRYNQHGKISTTHKNEFNIQPEHEASWEVVERVMVGDHLRSHLRSGRCKCGSIGWVDRAHTVTWPHTVALDLTTATRKYKDLSVLTPQFEIDDKELILRGCILLDEQREHFITLIKCEDGWMQYDGLSNPHKFKLYSCDETQLIMEGSPKTLVVGTYEVTDNNTSSKVQDFVDWEELFDVERSDRVPRDIGESLTKLSSEILSQQRKHKMKGKDDKRKRKAESSEESDNVSRKKPKSASKQRIPHDFSLQENIQSRGPRPTCQGCGKRIEYGQNTIRHNWKEKKNFNYNTISQYHCEATCLQKLSREHMRSFMEKRWVEAEVVKVVRELQHDVSPK